MGQLPYSHLDDVPAGLAWTGDSRVVVGEGASPGRSGALSHALAVMRLASLLGLGGDALTSSAPLTSLVCGRRMFYLRGWSRCDGLVKGFSALGLLAEQAALARPSAAELRRTRVEFLASRRLPGEPARSVFSAAELDAIPEAELERIDDLCLGLWKAFARRSIVCSTSANMGISLHLALRGLRAKELAAAGKGFSLLNADEGELVIWCPDEKADFMNAEKAAVLRALAAEEPKRTILRPYLNRQQRDPGALKEALERGGHFFPTNPQSRPELQNLLSLALSDIMAERGVPFEDLVTDPNIRQALESLGAPVVDGRVVVQSALEAGMLGMAAPYLSMLEEALAREGSPAACLWNPASIGAALAALTACDTELRRGGGPDLGGFFPRLAACLREGRLGRELHTRIHGVFDIANLQSLAQLFGVPVLRHLSGRGTAYVGLGSSSYANGNLCFDILSRSAEGDGPFRGRDSLHPATHAVNGLAQALVYAEDLTRTARAPGFDALAFDARVRRVLSDCRKPEPAGAAALAGYLLARLDAGTLSFLEPTYALRAAGFTAASFLEFCGFGKDSSAAGRCVQQAGEEGPHMESLMRGVLKALDLDWAALRELARAERGRSRLEYRRKAFDSGAFEALNPAVHIHLTGDNCVQPSPGLVAGLLRSYALTKAALDAELAEDGTGRLKGDGFDAVS